MADKPSLWQEIRRRKIVQFALIYAAVGWLLIQVSSTIFPTLGLPLWSFTLVIVIVAIGFPLVIILAWAHETAPEPEAHREPKPESPSELATDRPSIAVLPFANMSDDREQEYLADGMTEDIITALAKLPGLFVVARNSSFTYKGKHPDVRDVGREFGVRYILEGSIRPIGDRMRITAQLVEAASGGHIWSENFDRPLVDLFQVQDEVVSNICDRLNVELRHAEHARAERMSPDEMTAWTWVAKAQNKTDYSDLANYDAAEEMLLKALEAEPDYPYALAMLGHLYTIRATSLVSKDTEEDRKRGIELVTRARGLAPSDAGVVSFFGEAFSALGEYEQAIEALERARDLAPNSPQIYRAIGLPLILTGRASEGIAAIRDGMARDPVGRFGQGHALSRFHIGIGYAVLDDLPAAIESLRASLRENDKSSWPFFLLAAFLWEEDDEAGAKTALAAAFALSPDVTLKALDQQVRLLKIGGDLAGRMHDSLAAIWPSDQALA